ncbi:cytochrome b [Paraburkholderia guartelaensis]|uniref:cytochrome b n=1 Tax=Paraburkholderia guartelaensis TaxID=2546446 RepID=UPI002AB6567B|nr:cytochrome b [Paraburkholderia guartelaensis]
MKHPSRYPFSVSLLHWLLAIALIGNLVIGWLLDDREELLALHKSIGVAILALALIRLTNRLRVRDQLPPSVNEAGTPAYFAESAVHRLLYVLMIVAPLLGWLKTNAAGHAASFFGLFSLPTLLSRSRELSHWLGQFHAIAAYSLAALIGLHMLGALVHRLLKGRNILPRILPFPRRTLPRAKHVPE